MISYHRSILLMLFAGFSLFAGKTLAQKQPKYEGYLFAYFEG